MLSEEGVFSAGLLACTAFMLCKQQSVEEKTSKKKYKKIDLHTHILPRTWPNLKEKYGYGGWIQLHQSEKEGGRVRFFFFETKKKKAKQLQRIGWNPILTTKDFFTFGAFPKKVCTKQKKSIVFNSIG